MSIQALDMLEPNRRRRAVRITVEPLPAVAGPGLRLCPSCSRTGSLPLNLEPAEAFKLADALATILDEEE